jgi:uncharacterized membrane protein YccC
MNPTTATPDDDDTSIMSRLGRAGREAMLTMLAALATLFCAMAIDPEPGPAVLAVVLCLSLSRSHLDRDLRGRLEAAVMLPVVGLVAVGVGALLHRLPWVGAAVFTAGMFVSIWLRRFGPMARRAGTLIALPFVVLLTTPHVPSKHAGHLMALLVPVIVALLALLWVAALHALGRRVRWLPPVKPKQPAPAAPAHTGVKGVAASTRMAVQMAVALAVSFVVGYVFFAERWGWIVLTAFIVNSGNRGRLDVAYKSVLRVLGAAVGTVMALVFTLHVGAHDATTAVLILAAVFVGMWLRPLGYAWWALCVTLALALLQGFEGTSAQHILWPRLEEIVIGAIIGVAAAWFVLPVRSTAVLRRRIADALAILADALDPATPARRSGEFVRALDEVQQIGPAFRATRLATRRFRAMQPADWVDTLSACRGPAAALIDRGETPGSVRKAVGAARKALREPAELSPALRNLHGTLTGNDESAEAP